MRHPDPMMETRLNRIRALQFNVASSQKQADMWQKRMDIALDRRMKRGLDGITNVAFDSIVPLAEKQLPKLRQEMADWAEQAERLAAALDPDDRAYL
jgi:isopenicillin N synthase-like dioxygenase